MSPFFSALPGRNRSALAGILENKRFILIATSVVLWMGELGRWWARRQAAVPG